MESPAESRRNFVPGLLAILRQAAWMRGALIALGVVLYLALYPGLGALSLLLAIGVERAAFIALVSWDALHEKPGALFAARARLAVSVGEVRMKNLSGFQNLTGFLLPFKL